MMSDEELRDDLGEVAGLLFETCKTIGRLNPNQTLTALCAAVGITLSEAGTPWSEGIQSAILKTVKQAYDAQNAPDENEPIH